jgi:hypothetical protein
MTVRQKLDALNIDTGDHDQDIHAVLDRLVAAEEKIHRLFMAASWGIAHVAAANYPGREAEANNRLHSVYWEWEASHLT